MEKYFKQFDIEIDKIYQYNDKYYVSSKDEYDCNLYEIPMFDGKILYNKMPNIISPDDEIMSKILVSQIL